MMFDKHQLSSLELEAQIALELPERQLLSLVSVFITDLLTGNVTKIDVSDINIANGICANVLSLGHYSCKVVTY